MSQGDSNGLIYGSVMLQGSSISCAQNNVNEGVGPVALRRECTQVNH